MNSSSESSSTMQSTRERTLAASESAPETPGGGSPKRGRKKKAPLFDDGQGDWRILAIMGADHPHPGCLVFIPEVPGFDSRSKAITHIKKNANQFQRMQVMIARITDIIAVQIDPNPSVNLNFKPRIPQDG